MGISPQERHGNALIVTHYDLDGFVCGLCLAEAYDLGGSHVRFVSYGVPRSRIIEAALRETEADSVYICDVGLDPEDMTARWARDEDLYRVLFDHHDSTAGLDTSAFDECHVDTTGTRCSADLVYEYLKPSMPPFMREKLKHWVALAHDRDLWVNSDRQLGQRVSWLLKDRIHQRLETALSTSSPGEFLRRLQGKWKRGEDLFRDAVVCATNTACLFDGPPLPIKVAYVKRDTSDVAEELQEGGQLVVLLNLFGQQVGVSLRTDRDDIDVSQVAQRCFGGGGHRMAASGFAKSSHLVGGFQAVRDGVAAVVTEQLAAGGA
jgi:oligoribonuclease NrnB/cAMP/cGMP phosphodiesterase (DHH superfamily)